MNVLVTGANGQLGKCLQEVAKLETSWNWMFTGSADLDITNAEKVQQFFENNAVDIVVNCAAYTAVDKAETDIENAYAVNAEAVKFLAENCKKHNALLIHISTDFVFDGENENAYLPTDITNPIGVYGASKLKGEQYVQELLKKYFIIRTSWVYSEFGNNFMKTMLRLSESRNELNVVADQIGCPTYAMDLAVGIVAVIKSKSENFGVYHFSNQGKISWFNFASEIFKLAGKEMKVNPIPASDYPTPAKRPSFSLLNAESFQNEFKMQIPAWKKSLANCLKKYQNA
ncbi:dTDP-4-dehydrorhamnose reductase [Pustulibacterium marinum]|uniref:dTDP-4-dehydrorhamnose reductase n=1 Tax=Pustulibacterium marinum TaxID=1224947 RepID=A0A1I7ETQ8_9FLAO|nr:dTDP-4-dehydrorhamnose reductase [Pustulibacterium marinum]SFU27278.1 dTDP-4-dehydrorhamnose reductase [Pustulibacterium marinum]